MTGKNNPVEIPLQELVQLRREVLHMNPELSGKEVETARKIADLLKECKPDKLITELGGHGVAAVFSGEKEGPTVMLRCELDALPINESTEIEHQSKNKGVSHKCGHDGHMVILYGVAKLLEKQRPEKGRVVLMFQPAEEDGNGAKRVIADQKFEELKPDWIFALHNLPGVSLNTVVVKDGRFNPAVNSFIVKFSGRTAHAAEPEKGINPALAMAELVTEMVSWTDIANADEFTIVTPVYQLMGEKAYGISAGEGEVHFTMRCDTSGKIKDLEKKAEKLAAEVASRHQLELSTEWTEEFYSSHNDPDAMDHIRYAAKDLGYEILEETHPFKWGEDFGIFTHHFRGAMFCLGAGEDQPALHHPDYDFPDDIIETGVQVFYKTAMQILHV